MVEPLPPFVIFLLGTALIPFIKGRLKTIYLLAIPILSLINLVNIPGGTYWTFQFLDYELILCKVDRLSKVFGYIFCIVAFCGMLYNLRAKNREHITAFLYIGSSLGVVFSGDYLSLFAFWEIMAFSSCTLIWLRGTEASRRAGLRYILVHITGGLLLLAGIIIQTQKTGSIEFSLLGLDGIGAALIFIGFIINAAVPPLHPWLTDAYPEATVGGAVFLSAFTTKTAVYVLCRAFCGTELLIMLGAIMTVYPIFYAVLENDIRRVLSYSLINQVGFMVCGIGIGTELAINGTVSHVFCHILYKALLFMSTGSVLYMTGKSRCTDIGGLYKTMPLTCIFCIIGAASISCFPLFSGFVSKSMVLSASAIGHMPIIWLLLLFASAGVFHHAGIKVPYFTFFAEDCGIRTNDPPINMLIAMGIVAFLCIFIGIFPDPLYAILPYSVDYEPYTAGHVVGQLQLLFFAGLAFLFLITSGLYPPEQRAINLDTDWFYRKGARLVLWLVAHPLSGFANCMQRIFFERIPKAVANFAQNPPDVLTKRKPIGIAVLLGLIFLTLYLLLCYG